MPAFTRFYEVDPRVMIERIDENHSWVTVDVFSVTCIQTNTHSQIELATHYINRSCNVDWMKTDMKLIFMWESKIVRWDRISAKCRFLAHCNLYENFTPIAYPWDGDSDTLILWYFKLLISCNILCICN